MLTRYLPTAAAVALAFCLSAATARADDASQNVPSDSKLQIRPAVMTTTADATPAISQVAWGRRAYRRGWYGYPYRSYSYYPYRYSYQPYYSYYRPYYGGYSSFYRPYYNSFYYPRYYSGYRGGFSFYGPRLGYSFYW
jgi:hypothetical protein